MADLKRQKQTKPGGNQVDTPSAEGAPKKITDPYPHADWQEKLGCYKKDIINAINAACHPQHLNNAKHKLENLQEKWSKEWDIK